MHHHHEHTSSRIAFWRTFLLLGLAVYFILLIVTGSLTNYINIRFSWLSYVAAALFTVLGSISAYDLLRKREEHHHEHDHEHDHAQLSWPVLAIVAVPLILGTLLPSQPLGASAVGGNISTSAIGGESATTLKRNPLDRNILDWLREFNQSATPAAFDGQPVDLTGFVYREPGFGETQFMIARFSISCCVADAFALGIPVDWAEGESLADGEWVRIQGSLLAGDFDGQNMPIIRADSVEIVPQPEHPYLYS